jgi:outer membrane protein assembly factor BamE (lipoprotein component of BamABCDE complex)
MRQAALSLLALILCSAALAGCSTTQPRTTPAAVRAAQGNDQPEPPTPGIKPLTVEQDEQFGNSE